MQATMMNVPLSINGFLERAGTIFKRNTLVSRLPDKRLVTHTYGQWHQRTLQLASALKAAGLQKGDRVATLCWNHHAHLEAYFGIPAAGGVMHTLNLRLSADELGWIAEDCKDRFLIVDDVLLPLYRQMAKLYKFEKVLVFPFSGAAVPDDLVDYEAFIAGGDAAGFTIAPHDENDPIAICYTSGTTGRPKGVAYSHRSTVLHTLVGCLGDHWGLKGNDVVMPVTPMFHANSWGMPYGAVMMGAKLVFPGPHLHPDDLLDLMQAEPPTLSLGVPTIWMSLIQAYERAQTDTPGRWTLPAGMRSLVGGAAVPESLVRAFDQHGIWIMQGWGMTETSPIATISYPRAELKDASPDERYRRAAMAGTVAPLVELRLKSDDGTIAPWDGQTMGEIQVRGPYITGSYHEVPVTEDKFTADADGKLWLRTGDVATMDDLGFVRITDRTKDLIKSGGEWISSVDVENALMSHPAVAEAAVIAIPDEKWSERPLACIVLKPGQTADGAALNALLLERGFVKWQLPERYEVIPAVPRTSTGKFWKLKLREMFPK
jgi:fatty-acyl-CoA synthase